MNTKTINETLISKIKESGMLPWQKPWSGNSIFPFNFLTGHEYRGVNRWSLLGSSPDGIPAFATCSPKEGRYPRKGSKAYGIIIPRFIYEKDENDKPTKKVKGIFFKRMNVFHYTSFSKELQEKVLEKYTVEAPAIGEAEKKANDFFDNYSEKEVKIVYAGDRAFYSPTSDSITVPPRSCFKGGNEFIATLCHEIAHSTGHSSRLDRLKATSFGSSSYSFEELIAEVSSVHMGYILGATPPINNSAAYLRSWLDKFDQNPSWLMKAFSASEKVIKFLQEKEYLPETEQEPI